MNTNTDKLDAQDPVPNALEIADCQYCSTAYDYKIHPKADRAIRVILKQLYQAATAEATQVEPLTDEQAKALLASSALLDMFQHIGWYSAPRDGFNRHALTLIRSIEAAHGIKVGVES